MLFVLNPIYQYKAIPTDNPFHPSPINTTITRINDTSAPTEKDRFRRRKQNIGNELGTKS